MVWYPDQSRTKLIAKYSHRSPPHQSACFKHWAKLICQWFDTKTELDSLWFPTHYLIIAAENKDESKHTSKTFFNRGHRARRHSWTALGWRCRQQRDDKRMKKLSKESSIIFHWTITDHNENQTVRTSCDPNHYQLNVNIFFTFSVCACLSCGFGAVCYYSLATRSPWYFFTDDVQMNTVQTLLNTLCSCITAA